MPRSNDLLLFNNVCEFVDLITELRQIVDALEAELKKNRVRMICSEPTCKKSLTKKRRGTIL